MTNKNEVGVGNEEIAKEIAEYSMGGDCCCETGTGFVCGVCKLQIRIEEALDTKDSAYEKVVVEVDRLKLYIAERRWETERNYHQKIEEQLSSLKSKAKGIEEAVEKIWKLESSVSEHGVNASETGRIAQEALKCYREEK